MTNALWTFFWLFAAAGNAAGLVGSVLIHDWAWVGIHALAIPLSISMAMSEAKK